MGKIKLNLVSGAIVEKPLINAFSANGNSYVVLDNEINGSMGLPIILVSKFDGSKLTKIEDQNEWQLTKEYLKNIIAGGQIEFISFPSEVAADDIYYTQLTLPVPSFDALKNAYNIEPTPAQAAPVNDVMPEFNPGVVSVETPQVADVNVASVDAPVMDNPVISPVVEDIPTPEVNKEPVSMEMPPVTETPVNEPVNIVVTPEQVAAMAPEVDNTPVVDIATSVMPPQEEVTPVEPNIVEPSINFADPTPVMDNPVMETPVSAESQSDLFKEEKEVFMQACDNMFEALVQKFKEELEKRK